jgi:hypothetical protein
MEFDTLNALQDLKQQSQSSAEWTYERLGSYIRDFENELDQDHEVGARLVSFGQAILFHIESLGYYGPDIISFKGVTEKGEKVKLIQNVSQLSVLLIAMPKRGEQPKRIGFLPQKAADTSPTSSIALSPQL